MEEITAPRKSQNTILLSHTKIENSIQNYLRFSPEHLDPICLKKQLELLQTTSMSFIKVQQKLVDKLDGDDEAKEQMTTTKSMDQTRIVCKDCYIYTERTKLRITSRNSSTNSNHPVETKLRHWGLNFRISTKKSRG